MGGIENSKCRIQLSACRIGTAFEQGRSLATKPECRTIILFENDNDADIQLIVCSIRTSLNFIRTVCRVLPEIKKLLFINFDTFAESSLDEQSERKSWSWVAEASSA